MPRGTVPERAGTDFRLHHTEVLCEGISARNISDESEIFDNKDLTR